MRQVLLSGLGYRLLPNWLRLFAASLFVIIIMVLLTGNLYSKVKESEAQFQYFDEVLDPLTASRSMVDWDLTKPSEGRIFTKSDAADLGRILSEVWHNLLLATRSGNADFIKDYFFDAAYDKAYKQVTAAQVGLDQGMVVLRQNSRPRVFHRDGSVVELLSDNVVSVRYVLDEKNDRIQLLNLAKECSRQIMVLRSIGWMVRNHELDCTQFIDPYASRGPLRPISYPLKGINYYPAETPWLDFWHSFDEKIIEHDLQTMQRLGAGSLRIFIPFDYFHDPKTSKQALERLDQFLHLSKRYGLMIIPTLFDFRNSYDPLGWAEEYDYLIAVAKVLRPHDHVALIDLKNEPDLDYKIHGKARVDMWLIAFTGLLRDLLPDISITIGWLDHQAASRKARLVDVVSYHEYGDPSLSRAIYHSTKQKSLGKPVIISEIGQPSWELAMGMPFSQLSQSQWLGNQFKALQFADGLYIWTLHDFSYEAVGKVAHLPWRKKMQASFGLFTRNGTPKLSATLFKNFNPHLLRSTLEIKK